MVVCTLTVGRTLAVGSLAMIDLRAEIELLRSREDDRATIERLRERHRNLDDHYECHSRGACYAYPYFSGNCW
jgi:hypothetical protein